MRLEKSKNNIKLLSFTVIGTIIFSLLAYLTTTNHLLFGLGLVLYGIISYFYIVLFIAERNWMDIRAIFSATWISTIGLSALRLTEYQEKWQTKTWVLVILAHFLFQIFATLGINYGDTIYTKFGSFFKKIRIGRISFNLHENRLFLICVITTLIGLACFILSIAIKGFIPCFSDSTTAYSDFYTKFHIFSVASTIASGLCFYCIKTQKISITKKIILGLCILYLVFIFPIMIVSRGIFLTAALSLITAIFYTCGKKLWVLCLSLVLIAGIYLSVSTLRNYTDAQLDGFFEPSEIQIGNNSDKDNDKDTNDDDDDPDSTDDDKPSHNSPSFKLSPKMSFVYSYLTVSHDNFNLAVKYADDYTWGARQMVPFNVIIRSEKLESGADNSKMYLVRPHLNTVNLIGDAYYDFHEIGVILFCIIWPFIFGLIQTFYTKSKNYFWLLILGNTMMPVGLCFFSTWMSIFAQWMLWGTVLLMFIACTININKKHINS